MLTRQDTTVAPGKKKKKLFYLKDRKKKKKCSRCVPFPVAEKNCLKPTKNQRFITSFKINVLKVTLFPQTRKKYQIRHKLREQRMSIKNYNKLSLSHIIFILKPKKIKTTVAYSGFYYLIKITQIKKNCCRSIQQTALWLFFNFITKPIFSKVLDFLKLQLGSLIFHFN